MKRIDFELRDKAFRDLVDRSLINIGFVVSTEFNTRIYRDSLLNVAAEAYCLSGDIMTQDTLQSRLPLFDVFLDNLYSEKSKMWAELKRHL